jgi:hypothetical protein
MPTERAAYVDHPWKRAKNVGSVSIPAHGVVEVTGSSVDVKGRVILQVQRPSATCINPDLLMVCGLFPIGVGKTGRVTNVYPAFALYTTDSPAVGQVWGSEANSFLLALGCAGFTIIGGSDSSVVRVVKAGYSVIGKLDGTLSKGSSVAMSIWKGAGGSETDSTLNVTVYDWLLATGQTIASGIKVKAEFVNGVLYVTAAECA